jgi:hypothetical protein
MSHTLPGNYDFIVSSYHHHVSTMPTLTRVFLVFVSLIGSFLAAVKGLPATECKYRIAVIICSEYLDRVGICA